jgi:hypothetical protein
VNEGRLVGKIGNKVLGFKELSYDDNTVGKMVGMKDEGKVEGADRGYSDGFNVGRNDAMKVDVKVVFAVVGNNVENDVKFNLVGG